MLDNLSRVMVRINEINSVFGDNHQNSNQPASVSSFHEALTKAQDGVREAKLPGQSGTKSKKYTAGQFDQIIREVANKYGVDFALVKSVIKAESGGNPLARSKAGALGLMQLMPSTARSLGVKNPLDPVQNIEGGTKYLKKMINEFKDIKLALAAYNAGPGAVRRYGGIPPYKETQRYVVKVLDYYENYANG